MGRRRDDPGTFPNAEINLGEIYLAKGDVAEAANCFESAYRFWGNPRTSQWMRWRYAMRLFAGMGELGLARGDSERATEFADRCLDARDAHELAEEPGEGVAPPRTDRPGRAGSWTMPRRRSARPSPSPRRSAIRRSSG